MRMHDLIGAGVAAVRQQKRWTQEDAAREFRYHGLSSWRTGTVGQLEAGLRRPRLDEVVLICAALGVALEDLLPDSDEAVELGDGAWMTSAAIRAVLDGSVDAQPFGVTEEMSFPGEEKVAEAIQRSLPQRKQTEQLLAPISQYADGLLRGDVRMAFQLPTDAERHAARRLGLHPAQIKLASRALWDHRDFASERDRRVGDVGKLEARSRQARRGLVTRAMLAELRDYVAAARAAFVPPVVAAIVTSPKGVLITARKDGKPPWGFVTGEAEPGEDAEDAAIREVKEETGLEVRVTSQLGERDHPGTGRHMIYIAARPVRGTKVFVGDEAELAEVRWASLDEAEELLPGMFPLVRDYLAAVLPDGVGR
jgi:ADP-ribose pyrophosphatase YjhB (NUDIX family)/transcriptional regulator with XRE-family HTH domain